jgi:hypothetical protein
MPKKKSVKTARSLFQSVLRRWLSISPKRMSGTEAAELLRREATRFENESQELH